MINRIDVAFFPWLVRRIRTPAGSQFFICHADLPRLDHQYTTFGKLIKGEDVLDKIANTPTHPPDRPDKRINVDSITIVPRSEAMKGN